MKNQTQLDIPERLVSHFWRAGTRKIIFCEYQVRALARIRRSAISGHFSSRAGLQSGRSTRDRDSCVTVTVRSDKEKKFKKSNRFLDENKKYQLL